jgi:hypothetical protein
MLARASTAAVRTGAVRAARAASGRCVSTCVCVCRATPSRMHALIEPSSFSPSPGRIIVVMHDSSPVHQHHRRHALSVCTCIPSTSSLAKITRTIHVYTRYCQHSSPVHILQCHTSPCPRLCPHASCPHTWLLTRLLLQCTYNVAFGSPRCCAGRCPGGSLHGCARRGNRRRSRRLLGSPALARASPSPASSTSLASPTGSNNAARCAPPRGHPRNAIPIVPASRHGTASCAYSRPAPGRVGS